MDDNSSLVPRQSSDLISRTSGLAKRGLEIIHQKQVEVDLGEAEVLPFIQAFDRVLESIGEIPDEFLNGNTANPHDIPSFNVHRFLEAFDRISMREGYVLDYVYALDGNGGEPLVYARGLDVPPLSSPDEYYDKFSVPRQKMLLGREPTYDDSLPYLTYLEFENTPIGCFQFALFCMSVRRFYLFWHSNYNDREYLLTKAKLDLFIQDEIGDITQNEIELLKSISVGPKVKIIGTSSHVTLLNFGQDNGYSYLHVYLNHANIFERFEDQQIVESHLDILY